MRERLATAVAALRRLGCTPAEAAGVGVLALASVALVAMLWFTTRPAGAPARPMAASTPAPSEGVAATLSDGEVIVHVAGAVAAPGVYTLPGGSRVGDAVTAAGGPARKAVLDGLNLARPLTDGEQILVPDRRSSAAPPQPSATAAAASEAAAVSLNEASAAELETLPGIGPVLAGRIIQHRDSVGGFKQVGELRDVPGIGEKTFQALADLVSL